jgi:hypothetical protein
LEQSKELKITGLRAADSGEGHMLGEEDLEGIALERAVEPAR